ncbi:hypothetical protein CC53_gp033 [Rhizobium phage vB_RleS_L338C]|uniref:hypothetical protein n=1 Tax=Rhizobium phage vB_RleS_L338C TaxID=1414737 RepID=UPI0003D7B0EE|nr:hypothetical protein CC53_gp033 [Rhizobium phage vB_RleS_L338C]AHC30450.1 hypothetical protein L338C_033 [Rhizobium phage vB_RleS_L338C]
MRRVPPSGHTAVTSATQDRRLRRLLAKPKRWLSRPSPSIQLFAAQATPQVRSPPTWQRRPPVSVRPTKSLPASRRYPISRRRPGRTLPPPAITFRAPVRR